jgi:hypothetical protein
VRALRPSAVDEVDRFGQAEALCAPGAAIFVTDLTELWDRP